MADPTTYRLIYLFFGELPSEQQIHDVAEKWPSAATVHYSRCDEHSQKAAMWTRNPTGKIPNGRLALEFEDDDVNWTLVTEVAHELQAEALWCLGTSPIPFPMAAGETFAGTLQLCCFERAQGLPNEALKRIWFDEHVKVAIETQNTEGYRQSLALRSTHEYLDGVVEELFPIEAATSFTAFFADGEDEAKMMDHIRVLTESSERVLDLEKSSVIHMTDKRIR